MWIRRSLWALSLLALPGGVVAQDAPRPEDLSDLPEVAAPEWLSDAITRPHANVATSVTTLEITTLPLDAVDLNAAGLLPTTVTGLPPDLWGVTDVETLARLFAAQPVQGLPAMQRFTETLALASIAPPDIPGADPTALFLARLDMLLARGALDQARALIERAGAASDAEVFRRFFDVSLLTGDAARACRAMDASPDIAPTLPARIFCLSRSGDWAAAALILGTGEALGQITTEEADLIARFLDPELFEDAPPLPPDLSPTPLVFEMRVALGERPATAGLPLAFAYSDLADRAGWRAQLDAAERLTRAGAIAPTEWFDIYTSRVPSASGAVWDRVAAVQALDAALLAGDTSAIATRLPRAWAAATSADLDIAFAEVFIERLLQVSLPPDAQALVQTIGLLSPRYEEVALSGAARSPLDSLAFAIARGMPPDTVARADLLETAVAAAFALPAPAHRYTWFERNNRLGEALLRAARVLSDPGRDPGDVTDALLLFRDVGLEDVARRAALQLILRTG